MTGVSLKNEGLESFGLMRTVPVERTGLWHSDGLLVEGAGGIFGAAEIRSGGGSIQTASNLSSRSLARTKRILFQSAGKDGFHKCLVSHGLQKSTPGMRRRAVLFLSMAMVAGPVPQAWADRTEEIARIHLEALGGTARIRALVALRMTGTVETASGRFPFILIAARPNRVRMETRMDGRTVIQASDGVAPPWEFDPANPPGRARPMAAEPAAFFLVDADFDDPLVAWRDHGYGLEPAGEAELDGRRLLRLLVVRSLTQNVFILIDPQTYLIALRGQTLTAGGRLREIVSRYDHYRPVMGVLMPHEVTVYLDGKLSQRATFESIEPNPQIPEGIFSAPQ